jgi:hypothetical protein
VFKDVGVVAGVKAVAITEHGCGCSEIINDVDSLPQIAVDYR